MLNYNFQSFGTKGIPDILPPYLSGVIPEVGIMGIYPAINFPSIMTYNVLRRGQGTYDIPETGGIIRVTQGFNGGDLQAYYPNFDTLLVSVALNSEKTSYQGRKGFVPKLGGIEVTFWKYFRYIAGGTWIPFPTWLEQVTQSIDLEIGWESEYSMWDNVGYLPMVNNALSSENLPTSDCFLTVSTEVALTIDLTLLESVGIRPILDR